MCDNKKQNVPDEFKRQSYAVPPEIVAEISEICNYFGYEAFTTGFKNSIRVGISVFKSNPEQYRKLLTASA
jgi:AraC-like DNA-binding protein